MLAGDGALRMTAVLAAAARRDLRGDAFAHPPVDALAVHRARPGTAGASTSTAVDVAARYLREADARINWETRRAQGRPTPARPAGHGS